MRTAADSQAGACGPAQAESRVREAALSFAARTLGELMSGPLQSAAGVDAPAGRREQRTDLSGQRWSPDGALNVLWVRALIKDGIHDQYWGTHRNRSRSRTAA